MTFRSDWFGSELFIEFIFHLIDLLFDDYRTNLVFFPFLVKLIYIAYEFLHSVEAAKLFDLFSLDIDFFASEGREKGQYMFAVWSFAFVSLALLMVYGEGLYVT